MPVSGTNFGKAAQSYSAHRVGFPDSLYERLADFQVGLAGQTLVDLGTGTGTLARGFASRGCSVTGVDVDPRMLEQARTKTMAQDLDIDWLEATAEATGLASATFDAVIAGQCWHWFNRPQAIAESLRILKSSGTLVIAHFDWLPLPGNVVSATEGLIESYNPDWHLGGGTGVYPQWLPELSIDFAELETFSYDTDVSYSHKAWRARIQASAGVAALRPVRANAFDNDLQSLLVEKYSVDPLQIPHRVSAIVARASAATAGYSATTARTLISTSSPG